MSRAALSSSAVETVPDRNFEAIWSNLERFQDFLVKAKYRGAAWDYITTIQSRLQGETRGMVKQCWHFLKLKSHFELIAKFTTVSTQTMLLLKTWTQPNHFRGKLLKWTFWKTSLLDLKSSLSTTNALRKSLFLTNENPKRNPNCPKWSQDFVSDRQVVRESDSHRFGLRQKKTSSGTRNHSTAHAIWKKAF